MKRLLLVTSFAAALAALAALPSQAQTLRWASQGDAQTMDPHSQNESLTNSINGQVYELLVSRDKKLVLTPTLATEWQQLSPTQWRFKLRPNVKFHDGTPFTADDVVYSVIRAREGTSDIKVYANAVGEPTKIDNLTVEFKTKEVNPVFLEHMATIQIMSKVWSEKHKATKAIDYKNKEEGFATFNANGTGPFMLVSRQPDVKTVFKRNPAWWGPTDGNIQEVIYTPIKSDATRVAALLSGELDFILDPAPQDVARLRASPGVKIIDGPENRVIFIGMDQARDELLYSSVKGKNPFKDIRVRKALYDSIDIETIRSKLMRGQAFPTGGITPSPLAAFNDPAIENRRPYDLEGAKKLMIDAGYPQGFEVTLDCPNNRYINDEKICIAVAAMWTKVGVKAKLRTLPLVTYFPMIQRYEASIYMLGWGVPTFDALYSLQSLTRSLGAGGDGNYNVGRYSNPQMDALVERTKKETDLKVRTTLLTKALQLQNDDVSHIPLHNQIIPWAMKKNIDLVHRADNRLDWRLIKVN